jgi:dTDP-3-amino-2,3,6-trideoxy-4-keto-D-glucose/dTDP-3-amino-3,4,6-trideoxy-alpha-D-glucose/dTDP-2,6-dideoxy-D-kanosamine transaminase
MRVAFSYLDRQFIDIDAYLADIKELVLSGDFTLGEELAKFEASFAALCGVEYAVGVGTGTDALSMPLKVLGIGVGDEVITTSNTFIATVGAIVMTGATPVFVDSEDGFVIDANLIEAAITPRTKAIMPVHYSGNVADMPAIMEIAERHGLYVVEDACQAINGSVDGKSVGKWGDAAGFSLHPLKNLNVWGDGGVVVTRSEEMAAKLRLYRNHGMVNRDEIALFGINCRLDTLQAVIGNRLIGEVEYITNRRIENAGTYDAAFADMGEFIRIPTRRANVKHVYHLYMVRVERRDELLSFLQSSGVEAKVHYPIPVHMQEASKSLGYGGGDLPFTEADAKEIITLPAHQHLRDDEIQYAIDRLRMFYLD